MWTTTTRGGTKTWTRDTIASKFPANRPAVSTSVRSDTPNQVRHSNARTDDVHTASPGRRRSTEHERVARVHAVHTLMATAVTIKQLERTTMTSTGGALWLAAPDSQE